MSGRASASDDDGQRQARAAPPGQRGRDGRHASARRGSSRTTRPAWPRCRATGVRWSTTQSWIASSHGRWSRRRRRRAATNDDGRRPAAASRRGRAPDRASSAGACGGTSRRRAQVETTATTSPMTRSIVTSSRQPTRRFSPCSPIAGVDRDLPARRRPRSATGDTSPPTVPAHTAHSAAAAAGSPRWTSRVGDRERDGRRDPARTTSGRFCVSSAMPTTQPGDGHERRRRAGRAASSAAVPAGWPADRRRRRAGRPTAARWRRGGGRARARRPGRRWPATAARRPTPGRTGRRRRRAGRG